MKLILLFLVFALVYGTKAIAADPNACDKLKITGKHECSLGGDKLLLTIKKIEGVLTVIADSEKEAFVIDGKEHPRYQWSNEFTYSSICSKKELVIDSFKNGQSEGTIVIAPKGSSIAYSISKAGQTLSLSCRKI